MVVMSTSDPTFSPKSSGMKVPARLKIRIGLVILPLCLWLYWGPFRSMKPLLLSAPRINWQPCVEDASFFCGYLDVPTDYDNPSAGTSRLRLTNYPAPCPQSERLGIILINYGGPGVPGSEASFDTAPRLSNLTGSRHDIISFDQRGLGRSTPKVNCFGSALKYEMFKTNTVFETTFSVPKDPFSAAGRAVLIEQQKEALALEEAQGALCAETLGAKALGFMSTTTTIYDMEEISKVMEGEDAPLNFYGGSYGTIVGAYLANMLPHKAGKIVIDGVVPGDAWSNEHYDSQVLLRLLLTDSEKTYQLYLSECFEAGPEHCPLTHMEDKSAKDIEKRVDDFIDRVEAQPLRGVKYSRPGYLTSGGVRSSIFTMLQMPEAWPRITQMLAAAINNSDPAPLMALIYRRYSDPSPTPQHDGYIETGQGELLRLAIFCGDALPYVEGEQLPTAESIVDDILVTMKTLPRFGATVHLMEQHGGCHLWPGTGAGPKRFTGPFNKTLTTPALIVANTHDPITPYDSAKLVKNTMGDSARLLVQDVAGHSYLAPTTSCAARVISNYFAKGVIPEDAETFCKREIGNYFTDTSALQANPKLVAGLLGLKDSR
ncbi:hypothetical protein R3P38DRAFT_2860456 [Favolaschia claudopus]|uniref:Uncharacterized protein n=1 Tax=Favolaschia claudopus TaxID=2862362 RepID=A0AAW0DN24_9AGAR